MKKGWLALLFLLAFDLATKILAVRWIPPFYFGEYPFGGIGLFSSGGITFSLNYIVNTGAAWGVFAGHSGLLFALRMSIILFFLFFVPKRFPIWLVLAGVIGNAMDYCFYGHVIDFLHFTFWGYSFPIFNFADSCITIGIFSMVLFPRKVQKAQAL